MFGRAFGFAVQPAAAQQPKSAVQIDVIDDADQFKSDFKPVIVGPTVVAQIGGQQVKLMTDTDVYDEIRLYMNYMKTGDLEPILRTFKNAVNSLLSFATEQVGDDEEDAANLDRARRMIGFCPAEEIFIRSKDKIWAVRDHILGENLQYFMDRDYSNMIKRDQKQEMLENIVYVIKDYVEQMSAETRAVLWTKGKIMLRCVALYIKLRESIDEKRKAGTLE